MFLAHYWPALLLAILASAAALGGVAIASRWRWPKRYRRLAFAVGGLIPIAVCSLYFCLTARTTLTLTLLNSEDDGVAERAYQSMFRSQVSSVEAALKL